MIAWTERSRSSGIGAHDAVEYARKERRSVNARLGRWRCRNQLCDRRIFTERVPSLAATPFARRTARLAGIVRLLGHSAGGRPSERLMRRLGMPVSEHDDPGRPGGSTPGLGPKAAPSSLPVHAMAGVDDWAWRKGSNYGTIIVDLERREVVDVLVDRSAATTASWFKDHPDMEVVSRDRAGLYAGRPRVRARRRRGRSLRSFSSAAELPPRTIERQLGGYAEAADSEVCTSILTIVRLRYCRFWRSRIVPLTLSSQTRLMGRGRRAVPATAILTRSVSLFEGGSSVGENPPTSSVLVADGSKGGSVASICRTANTMTSTPSHPGVFRRSAGTAVGRRHYQSPALVRRDTPSRLYRVLQSSGAFPCTLAQRRAFSRG